jgi:hypothetical protein
MGLLGCGALPARHAISPPSILMIALGLCGCLLLGFAFLERLEVFVPSYLLALVQFGLLPVCECWSPYDYTSRDSGLDGSLYPVTDRGLCITVFGGADRDSIGWSRGRCGHGVRNMGAGRMGHP